MLIPEVFLLLVSLQHQKSYPMDNRIDPIAIAQLDNLFLVSDFLGWRS